MGAPKNILGLYQDGVELKTVLASVSKGKILIKAFDQATLVTPFQQYLEDEGVTGSEGDGLESAGDVFGFADSAPSTPAAPTAPAASEEAEATEPIEHEATESMVEVTDEAQFESDDTNEDILHSLLSRVAVKNYSHAINLPRSLAHTFHLRTDFSAMKPKERSKEIFNEIVERLNDTVIPKDHYACLFTPQGDAYAFVYKADIPLIHAFDSIKKHLKAKPRFVSVCPDEIALVNLFRYNYDVDEDEVIALVNIEDVQTSFIVMQGKEAVHFSQSIREGLKSPSLLTSISGRLLYEQDIGNFPDITRIILTGEASQIEAKEHFARENPSLSVDYLSLDPDKFILPEESDTEFTGFAVPLGLAVQALLPKKPDTIPINLLPGYVLQRQKTFKLAWHGMLLLLLIFLVPLGINSLYMERVTTKRDALQKISYLEKSIDDISWVTHMVDSLTLSRIAVQKELTSLIKLSEGTQRWSATFKQVLVALEEVNGIWFGDLMSRETGIELVGFSLYRNRIPRLIEYFDEAEISSVVPAEIRGKTVYKFTLSIKSIVDDTTAFHPRLIEPPPMPIQSLESSSPITIIDENEESISAPDPIEDIQIALEPDPIEILDTLSAEDELEHLADSLLPPEVFDTLMPMTPDISRLADSLAQATNSLLEPSDDDQGLQVNGVPITALKVHRVRRGETLKIIADKKLGSETRWLEIYNLNRDILTNPNRLAIGQKLIVLEDEENQKSITHVVAANENLKVLASMYYGDEERWESIYKLNKKAISNPNKIFLGQELTIMTVQQRYRHPIQTHTIKSGETLKIIAKLYLGDEARWKEIIELNKKTIKHPDKIFRGQRIMVRNETGAINVKKSKQ